MDVRKISILLNEIKVVVEDNCLDVVIASTNNQGLLLLPFFIEKEFDSKYVSFLKEGNERIIKVKNTIIRFHFYKKEIKPMVVKYFKKVIFYD